MFFFNDNNGDGEHGSRVRNTHRTTKVATLNISGFGNKEIELVYFTKKYNIMGVAGGRVLNHERVF